MFFAPNLASGDKRMISKSSWMSAQGQKDYYGILKTIHRILVDNDTSDTTLLKVIDEVGVFLDLDVITVYLLDSQQNEGFYHIGWSAERMGDYKLKINRFFASELSGILDYLKDNEIYHSSDSSKIDIVGAELIAQVGLKSIAIARIKDYGKLEGYIAYDDFRDNREWTYEELDLLTKATHIIGGIIMRRQAEEKLKSSNLVREIVLNNINSFIFAVDRESAELLYANDALLRCAGITAEDIVGKRCCDFFCDPDNEQCEIINMLQSDTQTKSWESMNSKLGGWFSMTASVSQWADSREAIVVTLVDVTTLKFQQEEIKHLVYYDTMLDIPNRLRCEKDITKHVTDAVLTDSQGAVVLIDLDDFKNINDSFGHGEGDKILTQISDYLSSLDLPHGNIYRFGGDEFMIVLHGAGEREAVDFIKGVLKRFKEPWVAKRQNIHCGCSVGVALYPRDGNNSEDIIRSADLAMYLAKSKNKGGYAVYVKEMDESFLRRIEIERGLRRSINERMNGFMVFYQPIVDPATGTTKGAEALIRWEDRDLGMLYPDSFISVAEYHGLIVPIGEWVLIMACKFCVEMQNKGHKDFYISVNLSVKQLQAPNIILVVKNALAQTGLDAKYLLLEITESVEIINVTDMINKLRKLRKLGVKIAMDDFGTGYSSLGNLRKFPLDVIKIDKSFIQNVDADKFCKTFIRSITELAHSINMTVCVEGVETENQLNRIGMLKADTIQGYYFSRPVPRDSFLQYISNSTKQLELQ